MTKRIQQLFFFFNMTQRIEYDSKNCHPLFNMTQRIVLFLSMTERIVFLRLKEYNLFFNLTRRIQLFDSKIWTFLKYESKIWTLLKYESKIWILLKYKSKIWTLLKYDSRNWTLFGHDSNKELSTFFEYEVKNWTSFQYDSEDWTFFFNMTYRSEHMIQNVTLRIEPFFLIWPKGLFFSCDSKKRTLSLNTTERIEHFEYDSKELNLFTKKKVKELNFLTWLQRIEPFFST